MIVLENIKKRHNIINNFSKTLKVKLFQHNKINILYALYSLPLKFFPKNSNNKIKIPLKYKFNIVTLIFILLFSFVINQSNISYDLIKAAYFNSSKTIHISYEDVKESTKKFKIYDLINKISEKYNINTKYIDNERLYKRVEKIYDEYNNKKIIKDELNICKKLDDKKDEEAYLFDFLKGIILTCVCSFFLYFIIDFCYSSNINNSFIINSIASYITYNILSTLYRNKYYLASGFISTLFSFFIKCTIDSIFLLMKFKREDFEIFTINLSAIDYKQFILKFTIFTICTTISYIMSNFYFKLYFNYLISYSYIFTLILFLCNCLKIFLSIEKKHINNIIIFITGIINLIINKCHNRKYYDKNEYNEHLGESKINSLYLISDIFSLLCFIQTDDLIENKYKDYFNSKNIYTKKFQIFKDYIWVIFYAIGITLGILGIYQKEYIYFFLCVDIAQKFNNYFSIIFRPYFGRILTHIFLIIFIILQYQISNSGDEYLLGIFAYFQIPDYINNLLLKIISVSILAYYIINILFVYYISINDEIKRDDEEEENNENSIDEGCEDEFSEKNFNYNNIENSENRKKMLIFLVVEFFLCYIDLVFLCVIVKEFEDNFFVNILYGLLIIILLLRKFYLIRNLIKNKYFFSLIHLIVFLFDIRLIILTNNKFFFGLHYIFEFNLTILLINYSFMSYEIDNFSVFNVLILIHLYLVYLEFSSTFIMVDSFVLIFLAILKTMKNKKNIEVFDKNKNNHSLIFLILIMICFILQVIGINTLIDLLRNALLQLTKYIKKFNLINIFTVNKEEKIDSIEFIIIINLFRKIKNI